MTIASTASKITHIGNDAATTFAWNFRIDSAADLEVVLTSEGTDTVLSSSLYSATGFASDSGGTVTYPLSGSPITSAQKLTIRRKLSVVQDTDFSNQGTQYPEAIERAIDRVVMMVQQNAETLARALVLSVTDNAAVALPPAAQRANKYLSFDAAGNPSVATTIAPGTLTISAFMETVILAASAAAARTELGIGSVGTLGEAPADTILGNPTGALATPSFGSLSSHIARIGNTRGMLLHRGSSAWGTLALGDAGDVLSSNGTDLVYVKPVAAEGSYKNLVVAAAADTTVTVTADWVIANNSSNALKLLRTVSLSIGTGTGGANGLDTGTIANDTWYSVWVMYNPTIDTTAGLLSLSATTPTLPAGYTFSMRVGWVRQATAVLRRSRQVGARAMYVQGSGSTVAPSIGAGSIGTVGLTNFVPSSAVEADFVLTATGVSNTVTLSPASPGTATTTSQMYYLLTSSSWPDYGHYHASVVLQARSVYASASGTGANIRCIGWKDSI